jgi:hypothetical protein
LLLIYLRASIHRVEIGTGAQLPTMTKKTAYSKYSNFSFSFNDMEEMLSKENLTVSSVELEMITEYLRDCFVNLDELIKLQQPQIIQNLLRICEKHKVTFSQVVTVPDPTTTLQYLERGRFKGNI